MKQREDTIRKWFSLWLDSREAELSDLFTEDAAYIESWGPEYYGREMIARWFRDWHRSGFALGHPGISGFRKYHRSSLVLSMPDFRGSSNRLRRTVSDPLVCRWKNRLPSRIRLHRKAVLSLWISNGCRILCVFTLILLMEREGLQFLALISNRRNYSKAVNANLSQESRC